MIAHGRDKPTAIGPEMVLEALNRGVREELKIHKTLGNPIAVGRDGKVVWIPAKEIKIDGEDSSSDAKPAH